MDKIRRSGLGTGSLGERRDPGAAGPRAGAVLTAGVLMLEGGFYAYIYKKITFFSLWVCFEKGLGNNED